VTGLPRFSIEKADSFARSFKKLAKTQGKQFLELIINPYPLKAREEPLPGRMQLPEGWKFHKLEIWAGKGASGQIRLMYLVNDSESVIKLLWIYSHEQFAKRPADKDLITVIQQALEESPTNPEL
jgi:mRNA-degrading endonuclease RelE of RelBE toxin-antitoxin system